jgi:hypothetical protein
MQFEKKLFLVFLKIIIKKLHDKESHNYFNSKLRIKLDFNCKLN